jgi:hypothetical protein
MKKLKSLIFSMVLGFKSKSQLSETLLKEVIKSFSKVFEKSIDSIIKLVINSLGD